MTYPDQPRSHQPAFNVPASVGSLMAGLAAVHVLLGALPDADDLSFEYAFVPVRYASDILAANHVAPFSFWDQLVPFFSYMALHSDWTHLGINLLWLLAFGPIVARRFGGPLFYVFFLMCGVAGALAHLAVNWGAVIPVIGASAAISGLMGAGIRMMPAHGPVGFTPANDQPLQSILSSRMLSFSAIWLAINAVIGMTGMGMGIEGQVRVIAWEAHMGGYLAGYFLAGPFDRWAGRPMPA